MTSTSQLLPGGRSQLAALLVLLPAGAIAAGDDAGTGLFDAAYLFQVLGSLLLVFGCLFGLIFLLKKLNGLPMAGGSPLRVLASARVGTREKILLLEAGEQQLLIGVAAGSIRTLHVLEQPIVDSKAGTHRGTEFASLLGSTAVSGQQR